MDDLLQVGIIANTHGLHGEAKVYPTTDDIRRFDALKEAVLDTGRGKKNVHITGVKYVKNMAVLRFAEYSDISDIEPLKGKGLYVARKDAVALEEDEYFIADLIGLAVATEDGEDLGRLTDVIQTGANDVYVVEKKNAPQLLIPALKECVLDVDAKAGKMTVHLLPGLVSE